MDAITKDVTLTKFTSPTRGETYSVLDALKKGFVRAELNETYFEVKEVFQCGYGSRDFIATVEKFGCSKSNWTKSISFEITGQIPFHLSMSGSSFSHGFGCGTKHVDSSLNPDGWDDYQSQKLECVVKIIFDKDYSVQEEQIFKYDELTYREQSVITSLLFKRMAVLFLNGS